MEIGTGNWEELERIKEEEEETGQPATAAAATGHLESHPKSEWDFESKSKAYVYCTYVHTYIYLSMFACLYVCMYAD